MATVASLLVVLSLGRILFAGNKSAEAKLAFAALHLLILFVMNAYTISCLTTLWR